MDAENFENQSQATSQPADERLDSWKEIATYFKRDVRTVRRWEETEKLPVHRHLHKKRGTVYAYKPELDRWWNNGRARLEQQEQTVAAWWRRLPWLAAVPILAAALAAAYFTWQHFWPPASAPTGRVLLAVLPFENLSGDPEQDYFSDGLTEEMITQLARLHPERLGVVARTSAMQYKDTDKSIDEIGRELRVDYILEGSVRREAERMRISTQLIRVGDQTHLWAESYDRDISGILALQGEIARAIANEIRIKLTPEEETRLASAAPVNPAAYQAYLRGRYFWKIRTRKGLEKAIEYFQQAIEDDPGYALAYAGLADTYNVLGDNGFLAPKVTYPKAKAAAVRALELDNSLAEAHCSLAHGRAFYDWDWAGAEKEFRRALELNPGYATAHHWYAMLLITMGRHDDAFAEIRRAQELDPLSPRISANVGLFFYYARRYDQAIEEFQMALETPHEYLGHAYLQKGKHKEAIAEYRKATRSTAQLPFLALGYAVTGKRGEAIKTLEDAKQSHVPPATVALVYAGLGEEDQAFAWLEKAYKERDSYLTVLKVDPMFWGEPLG